MGLLTSHITTAVPFVVDLDLYEDTPGLPSFAEEINEIQQQPLHEPNMAHNHAHGANPNGADPPETLRALFRKQEVESLIDRFLKPKDRGGNDLSRKIDSPEKYWKVGVNSASCLQILAAFSLCSRIPVIYPKCDRPGTGTLGLSYEICK